MSYLIHTHTQDLNPIYIRHWMVYSTRNQPTQGSKLYFDFKSNDLASVLLFMRAKILISDICLLCLLEDGKVGIQESCIYISPSFAKTIQVNIGYAFERDIWGNGWIFPEF